MHKKTSQVKNKNGNGFSGFSLLELLFTLTILLLMLASATSILISVNREFRTQKPRMESLNNVQTAMDSIARVVRMSGTKPKQCDESFAFSALTPSESDGNGNYTRLQIQADWNPADCALTGVDEDVTISVRNGNLYLDAARQTVFVDKIRSVRFRFFDSGNNPISDPVTNASQIKVVRVEVDTLVPDEAVTTVSTDVRLREK